MSEPKPFHTLGDYKWPSSQVNRGVDRLRERFSGLTGRNKKDKGIDPSRLRPAAKDQLDRLAGRPAHQPIIAELDVTLDAWVTEPPDGSRLKTIVLPPCDREDLLGTWAKARSLPVFKSDQPLSDLDDLDDPSAPPLIIPKLEHRFLRSLDGIDEFRTLLDRLRVMQRRLIIGCNSWAWQFLRKSCEIDLVLGEPLTFQAYDGERLRAWLGRLAHTDADASQTGLYFRMASDGRDVFGNIDGEIDTSNYMTGLAKRSLGIPWVAWQFWRESLYVETQQEPSPEEKNKPPNAAENSDKGKAETSPDALDIQTIWVTPLKGLSVPNRNDQNALLVLHALLIHGGLKAESIAKTIPLIGYTNVLSSLLRNGLIDETRGFYRCLPAAYPAIRDALSNSGYPVDTL